MARLMKGRTWEEDDWEVPISLQPSPPSVPDHPSAFPTYCDYLDYLVDKYDYRVFHVLRDFFKNECLDKPDRPPQTSMLIADLMDDRWRFSSTIDRERLDRTDGVRLRAVVIECDQSLAYVDRDVVDLVAAYHDLDPVAFAMFLETTRLRVSYTDHPILCERSPDLHYSAATFPTQRAKFLPVHFGDYPNDSIASFLVEPRDEADFTTVVMIGTLTVLRYTTGGSISSRYESVLTMCLNDSEFGICNPPTVPKFRRPIDMYRDDLQKLTMTEPTEMLAQCPVAIVLPYVHVATYQLGMRIGNLREDIIDETDPYYSASWNSNVEPSQKLWGRLLDYDESTSRTLKMLQRFVAMNNAEHLEATKALVQALEDHMVTAKDLRMRLESHLQRRLTNLSLEESRKSIQLSDSVALLTKVAFFFIPLTFSTSVFGMNVVELGSGPTPVWAFVVTSVVITASTTLIWALAKWKRANEWYAAVIKRARRRMKISSSNDSDDSDSDNESSSDETSNAGGSGKKGRQWQLLRWRRRLPSHRSRTISMTEPGDYGLRSVERIAEP